MSKKLRYVLIMAQTGAVNYLVPIVIFNLVMAVIFSTFSRVQ